MKLKFIVLNRPGNVSDEDKLVDKDLEIMIKEKLKDKFEPYKEELKGVSFLITIDHIFDTVKAGVLNAPKAKLETAERILKLIKEN